jgi:hypothetical protein
MMRLGENESDATPGFGSLARSTPNFFNVALRSSLSLAALRNLATAMATVGGVNSGFTEPAVSIWIRRCAAICQFVVSSERRISFPFK